MATIRALRRDDDLRAVSAVYARSWRQTYRGIVPQGYLDRLEDGAWLSSLAERWADRLAGQGFERGYLWTAEQNAPARRFYEAWGFTLSPERTHTVLDGERVWEVRYIRTQREEGAG